MRRTLTLIAATLTGAMGLALSPAGAAFASTPTTPPTTTPGSAPASPSTSPNVVDGNCYSAYVCYYYESNYQGSHEGVQGDDPDLLNPPVYFQYPGAGQGTYVANNAGSGFNGYPNCYATVYYSAYYTGTSITLSPYGQAGYASPTLGPVNNNDRSQYVC